MLSPALTSVSLLLALLGSPWGLGILLSLPGEAGSLSPTPLVLDQAPGTQPALGLSFLGGGTLSSLWSLNILQHWPIHSKTGTNSPL